ncbi:MAG: hypothetical protein DI598_09500 [Pseudopedobacter saltans]|uniref:PDZ domain-containing protein n=1 Tax=Pseudopedobacter saltans TaxID=151895 RepID=A0A2W5F4H3_9SPHI|nr:MAG: hypothetical protein DI598_09500 [Pseudopedobacter saltans]
MRILFSLFWIFYFSLNIEAQTVKSFHEIAQSAYTVYRLAEKYHVQPRALDDRFSEDVWNGFIDALDEKKLFFTAGDIAKLNSFKYQIDDEIKSKKSDFLENTTSIFVSRLKTADTIIENILKRPFNYKTNETFTTIEDTSFAKDDKAWREKIRKTLKLYVLNRIVDYNPNPTQKQIDSLDIVFRKKAGKVYRRYIQKVLEFPTGITEEMGNYYCETIASCYDPHTNFLSLSQKEDLESELGQKSMIFGFSLENDENDIASISKLIPGSTAYKSGQINVGDKILKLQWENKEAVDVSDASAQEIGEMLSSDNHQKLTLYIKKPDGNEKSVTLSKSINTEDEEDNKVKSFLLKGQKTVGYISLPAFYTDWENEEKVNGCANDVAKEIIKLKKENIDALILDVRYNGGGSVNEAVELAGLFIDVGPIGIVHSRNEKPILLKDINRGTVYDGPLLYMINGNSASASEVVGAALQDYNRALIVGSQSYGKATGQVIIPLDTAVNPNTYEGSANNKDFLKLTTLKLYRIDGNTAQFTGVVPDVVLPDVATLYPQREANEVHALLPDRIDGNKYYHPNFALPKLQAYADEEIKKSSYFTQIKKIIDNQKDKPNRSNISLNIRDFKTNFDENEINTDSIAQDKPIFSVSNNTFEQEKIQLNPNTKEVNQEWRKALSEDPYVQMVYRLALKLIQ